MRIVCTIESLAKDVVRNRMERRRHRIHPMRSTNHPLSSLHLRPCCNAFPQRMRFACWTTTWHNTIHVDRIPNFEKVSMPYPKQVGFRLIVGRSSTDGLTSTRLTRASSCRKTCKQGKESRTQARSWSSSRFIRLL